MSSQKSDYLIVGAGVNGTSIAHTLVTLGFSVTLLDRSPDGFVAPDGASHDLNKIIRADYTDSNYCTLAKEAISRWRTSPLLSRFYHEVGVLFRSSEAGKIFGGADSAEQYVENGVKHAQLEGDKRFEIGGEGGLKRTAYKLERDQQVKEILRGVGKEVGLGKGLEGMGRKQTGYFNPRGGWAEANNACRALLEHAIQLGVKVVPNARVTSFSYDGAKVKGVKTADGRTFSAKNMVVAAGAWTSDLLSTLSPTSTPKDNAAKWLTRPSAQCVAILRLTPEEAAQLKDTPVIINFSSGFYQFEPVLIPGLNEWQMKIAYHSNGYLYPKPPTECNGKYPCFEDSALSHPTGAREIGGEGARAEDEGYEMAESTIPADRLDDMLKELGQIYLTLAKKERVVGTRVCWYSDTLDENWIIDTLDKHPSSSGKVGDNVWVVSGDSGHAYKFLPMIGDLFASIAGLSPNIRNLDLSRFTFAHQARLHQDKREGKKVESADSNRFDAAASEPAAVQQNLRARL
ncbi:hypothetical protein NDA16_003286 [Ustilago loliicola]|nr:hypothetical protein NDA16_003286 [Ustilago loliicola]